jgi:hypothetical protein
MTERAEVAFVVKEGGDGKLHIVAEPTADMKNVRGLIGFDLKPGTTLEQAREIAKYMRQHIRGINHGPLTGGVRVGQLWVDGRETGAIL